MISLVLIEFSPTDASSPLLTIVTPLSESGICDSPFLLTISSPEFARAPSKLWLVWRQFKNSNMCNLSRFGTEQSSAHGYPLDYITRATYSTTASRTKSTSHLSLLQPAHAIRSFAPFWKRTPHQPPTMTMRPATVNKCLQELGWASMFSDGMLVCVAGAKDTKGLEALLSL